MSKLAVSPLVAALALVGSTAHAAFQFPTCSNSPAYDAPIPVSIGAKEFDPKPENPPGGSTDGQRYNLNTTSSWHVYMNPNVVRIQPYYGFFMTESGYDILKVTDSTGTLSYSGSINATTSPVAASGIWQPQMGLGVINALDVSWTSDYSVANYLPPSFSQVAVQCSNNVTNPIIPYPINFFDRTEGLLIKTGDVLYFRLTQPANAQMLLSLDAKATTTGADFDLYASTSNQFPDDSSFTWRSYTTNASEAIDIPASSSARDIYVGVHSYNGAGHFALHALLQASNERYALTVCPIGFTPDATQQSTLTSFFKGGSLRFLAATNGNVWLKTFNVTASHSSCDSSCSVCLNQTGSVSYGNPSISPQGCGQVQLGGGNWGGGAAYSWLYAHESGHSCLSLPDEYEPPPAGNATPMLCGHTIMSNHGFARFYCSRSHCKDGHTTDTARCDPASQNNWDIFTNGSHYHWGPDFSADGITADPTDYFNNPVLQSMVTVNF